MSADFCAFDSDLYDECSNPCFFPEKGSGYGNDKECYRSGLEDVLAVIDLCVLCMVSGSVFRIVGFVFY